jgi:hypothetical protein
VSLPPTDLPQATQSWPDEQIAAVVIFVVVSQFLLNYRTRPNKTRVATKNIEGLPAGASAQAQALNSDTGYGKAAATRARLFRAKAGRLVHVHLLPQDFRLQRKLGDLVTQPNILGLQNIQYPDGITGRAL